MSSIVRAISCSPLILIATGLQLSAQAPAPAPASAPAPAVTSRPITPAEMKKFTTLRSTSYTNNGKWFAYITGQTDSDAVVVLREIRPGSVDTRINVGNGGGSIAFSGDSKWFAYLSAPPHAAGGRGARGGGGRGAGGGRGGGRGGGGGGGAATPPDSAAQAAAAASAVGWKMVLMNLSDGTKTEFDGVRRFSFNIESPTWIVMQGAGAGGAAGAGGGAGRGGGGGRGGAGGPGAGRGGVAGSGAAGTGGNADLLLYNMATGDRFNLGHVDQYAFHKDGHWLAYTMNSADRIGNSVLLRDMKSGSTRVLENAPVTYTQMSWLDSSRVLGVVRTTIDSASSDTSTTWATFSKFGPDGSATLRILDPAKAAGFPTGYTMLSGAPRYSDDFSLAFFTIREKPKKTPAAGRGSSAIQAGAPGAGGAGAIPPAAPGRGGAPAAGAAPPAAADSTPSLIIWHYKDTRLQSQQIVQEAADRNVTYQAVLRVADNRVVQLTDSTLKTVTVTHGDKLAYGIDTRAYDERASYTGREWQDVYRVDLASGQRTLLQKMKWPSAMSASPDGTKLMYWGKDANYWVMDLASGDTVNITKGIAAVFSDMEDDHNDLYRPAAGSRGWSKDGKWVLLSDGWDIWKVATTPAPTQAVNLTGDGRKNQIRYQALVRWPTVGVNLADGIDFSKPLLFATYGEWTKKEGMSRVDPDKPGAVSIYFDDAKTSLSKARDAEVYFFTRMSFTQYPDWWTSGPTLKDATRLTDANPQIKELAWSSGTRLIDYKTDKGVHLQAAMYLPTNYQPGKQYPMLVTIYEKRSQDKNVFVTPSETRAPDPTLYTSRGYIVLDPDIVYQINDPGMSAVWAVVPAVKAAIATGMVDAKHVGLWGHSWGGYQTAFLVTQTNIFAAAVAGAPLTNMVSMYASIYWNSGGSDAAIFESSQGRFKGNFIDNQQAYIRNSPVFFANQMNTPLIILQNDKDGAVDFNQGVTYYNTLRQLGKPVIFLEYVGENHGLARPPNLRDYATRMSEFFDHYLKGVPAPDWLENGVPRVKMAEHLAARADTTAGARGVVAAAADSSGGRGGAPATPPAGRGGAGRGGGGG